MWWEAFVCLGSLILFALAAEYLTRDRTTPGHPIIPVWRQSLPEPNNLLEEAE